MHRQVESREGTPHRSATVVSLTTRGGHVAIASQSRTLRTRYCNRDSMMTGRNTAKPYDSEKNGLRFFSDSQPQLGARPLTLEIIGNI